MIWSKLCLRLLSIVLVETITWSLQRRKEIKKNQKSTLKSNLNLKTKKRKLFKKIFKNCFKLIYSKALDIQLNDLLFFREM